MVELMQIGASSLFFILMAIFIFVYVMAKHKERMTLIDKGVDPSSLYSKKYIRYTNLRNGILLVSLAVGLIVGYIMTSISDIPIFVAYCASLLLCEGLGFLLYYTMKKDSEA